MDGICKKGFKGLLIFLDNHVCVCVWVFVCLCHKDGLYIWGGYVKLYIRFLVVYHDWCCRGSCTHLISKKACFCCSNFVRRIEF